MHVLLYGLGTSNSTETARLILRHKHVDHTFVELNPAIYPLVLRRHGFRNGTVPALELAGRRIDGSLAIAQALETAVPEPPLYPADADARAAVEKAERWAEAELQTVPRRIARWGLAYNRAARIRLAQSFGARRPRVTAALHSPLARWSARRADADEARVRADLVQLRATLDRVDALIASGIIGNPARPNAADYQVAPSIRAIAAMTELAPLVEGRPCGELATRLVPHVLQLPPMLPARLLRAAGL